MFDASKEVQEEPSGEDRTEVPAARRGQPPAAASLTQAGAQLAHGYSFPRTYLCTRTGPPRKSYPGETSHGELFQSNSFWVMIAHS